MKKTLLATAVVAVFATAARAETSVNLYGVLDGGIGYVRITDYGGQVRLLEGLQSGNRWGLRLSEDLGNGLRAVSTLESGFDLKTGEQGQGGRLFGRQATLGLASDAWGQLDVGRQQNIASAYLQAVADPFNGGFEQANIGTAFSAANTVRYDNMVMYQTPTMSGFQFGVGYSFNVDGAQEWERDGEDVNKKAITTGLRYGNGPIGVALTYDQFKQPASQAVGGESVTVKSWALGGSYDFEVVKVFVALGQTRDGWFVGQGFGPDYVTGGNLIDKQGLKVNSYLLGLTAPLGNGELKASWQVADPRSKPDAELAADYEHKQNGYNLGYTYPLSKRTNVYALLSYTTHVDFSPTIKARMGGVGIRHRF